MFDPLYLALTATTILYAILLDRIKERIEPDFTWLEVVIGVCFCLGAAAIYAQRHVTTWQEYEAAVWWAFVYGGAPIIVWQFVRLVQRYRKVLNYALEKYRANTEALAEKRRERQK